ncbi:MAG: GNAT family N-acetyltransferase [Methylocystis sp.]
MNYSPRINLLDPHRTGPRQGLRPPGEILGDKEESIRWGRPHQSAATEYRAATSPHLAELNAAEAAFSVEKEWRGRGVGAALLARIVEAAREAGARTLDLCCLTHNRAMQGLVRARDSRSGGTRARSSQTPSWRCGFDADGFRAVLDMTACPRLPDFARRVA